VFGPIGGPEMVVILIIALLIFGPRKLPELAKSLGKGLSELRRTSTDLQRTLEREIHQENAEKVMPPSVAAPNLPVAVPTSLGTAVGPATPAPEAAKTWPDGRPGRPAAEPAATPQEESAPVPDQEPAPKPAGQASPDDGRPGDDH